MSGPGADRNLLFGILALQMDFIGRDDLVAAMSAWVLDKAKSLGEILRALGKLAEDEHALLEGLVRKHLERHGNDPQRSLAAVSSVRELGRVLFDRHAFAFEATSVLILVAMVGAVVLARREGQS